jgi:hypothetical protein
MQPMLADVALPTFVVFLATVDFAVYSDLCD